MTENHEQEIWKPCPDYKGIYEVSNKGQLRRMPDGRYVNGEPAIMYQYSHNGYMYSRLSSGGKKTPKLMHRLIARAFLGEPTLDHPCVNHINGIKSDNCVTNLEWVSHGENSRHAANVLGVSTGVNNGNAVLTEDDVRAIYTSYLDGTPVRFLAQQYRVTTSTITAIAYRTLWAHLDLGEPIYRRQLKHRRGGASLDKSTGKWKAAVKFSGTYYYLGLFRSRALALAACDEKRSQLDKKGSNE